MSIDEAVDAILGLSGTQPFEPIILGFDEHGRPIKLTKDDFYYHVHILGLSGRGKSRAIEYILRQFLLNRVGFTLLDPHGDIYDALVDWIAYMDGGSGDFLKDRTVHLFDPAHPVFSPGYNPLYVWPGEYAEDRVSWFLAAMAQALGGENIHLMQYYHLIFTSFMYALAEKGLAPIDAMLLAPESEDALRQWVSGELPNRVHTQAWRRIRGWTADQFEQRTSSFFSRLHDVFQSPAMQRIFGATENLLNPLTVMDEGHTVLVNLKDRKGFSAEASQLLGKILVNAYQQTAQKQRPANTARPHVLIIDECHDYLSGDIPRILDGTRKFGLHLVLAHQRIEQLYEAGENIAGGVMAGAQTKLIFGSTYKTGAMIADEIFGSTYDLERWKESSKRPSVAGYKLVRRKGGSTARSDGHSRTIAEGEGDAHAHTDSESLGGGEAAGHGDTVIVGSAVGEAYTYDDPSFAVMANALVVTNTENQGTVSADSASEYSSWQRSSADSHVHSRSRSVAEGHSTAVTTTENWQEVLEPIIEWFHTATFTVEEQRHERAVEVQNLDRQRLFLKRAMQRDVLLFKFASFGRPDVAADALTQRLMSSTGINTPSLLVDQAIDARQLRVQRMMGPVIMPPKAEKPLSFAVDAQDAQEVEEEDEILTSDAWLRRS